MLARELRPLDLTPAQAEALRILADFGPLTLTGLGEMLVCESGSNPSRLVDRLVGMSLVDRGVGAEDRRQITLSLTPLGVARAQSVRVIEEQMYAQLERALAAFPDARVAEFLDAITADTSAGQALRTRVTAEAAALQTD
jgi:DNA-binding MarR family transcriptional regulator